MTDLGIEPLEITDTDEATKLERELKKLVEHIPELGEFFGFWARKAVLQQSDSGMIAATTYDGSERTFPIGDGAGKGDSAPQDMGDGSEHVLIQDQADGDKRAEPISRTARSGPKISFASAPDRLELAWIDGNHVVINSGHPSYIRVRSNTTARRIHCFFAIGTAVQRFIAVADGTDDLMFIDKLMAAWGKK